MEIQQGYSYHIKDVFFETIKDDKLMSNKENQNYRPHYYAIQDVKNSDILWMIPISSQVEKYRKIIESKVERYGKCDTIILGSFGGKENAFLIQNAFPIKSKFLDHVHTIENKPVRVHKELDKALKSNLKNVLAMHKRGIKILFADVDRIMSIITTESDI